MESSKLIQLLLTFTSRELSKLEEFVVSPYFNKNKDVINLCSYLVKFLHHKRRDIKLSKSTIIKHVFQTIATDHPHFNMTFNRLLSLVYDFLIYENQQHLHLTQQCGLLAQLRQKDKTKDYKGILRKIKNTSTDYNHIEDQYWDQFILHNELDISFITSGGRSFDKNLQEKNDYLDLFFITKKLKIACDMVSRNKVISSDYKYRLVDELFVYLDQMDSPYKDEPSIQVYASLFKMLSQQTDDHYQFVLQKLDSYANQFSISEQRSIYDFVLNYLIGKYNQHTGQTSYLDEILNLYKMLVEKKIIYINGYLPTWEYKTIVTTAISLGYLEWTGQFIEQHKMDLPLDARDHSYAYNMSYYKYMRKDYKGALLALYDVNFNDWRYYTGAKMIQLRSYFELDEEEPFYSLIDAFRVYLDRKGTMPENQKKLYRNFIKLAAKLYKLKLKSELGHHDTSTEMQQLRKQIEDQNVASKNWLMDSLLKL